MYIMIAKNHNGSYTFSGYIKRTYYGYSLVECKKKYKIECKNTGYNGRIAFIMED